MPGSYPWGKREVARHIREQIGDARVLDVGAGAGVWADLIGHGRMDACEVHAPYVERFGLHQKYRSVLICDVRDTALWTWNYVILGDVLEHMPVEDAQRIVTEATCHHTRLMVALPYLCPQDDAGGVESERHLQDDLTPAVIAERYPELRLLLGDEHYGYFVNYDAEPLTLDPSLYPEAPHQIDLVWWEGQRGYWDHGLIQAWITNDLYRLPDGFVVREHLDAAEVGNTGAVLIVPGGRMAGREAELRAWIERRSWTLAVCVSDESGQLDHPALKTGTSEIVVQTPAPRFCAVRRALPFGWPLRTRDPKWAALPEKDLLWSFAGQITHAKRVECAEVLRTLPGGELLETSGFAQGMSEDDYLRLLRRSWVAPSPSGPDVPDAFRTWEALEMGCIPVVDRASPGKTWPGGDYYRHILGEADALPSVGHWSELRQYLDMVLAHPRIRVRAAADLQAWWIGRKRQIALDLNGDVFLVSGMRPRALRDTLGTKITVAIPTSPVPSHPSTAIIEECVSRVRTYPELADAEILITIDGVRIEQSHRADDYAEYVRRLVWLCNWDPRFAGVLPLVHRGHEHQARMLRHALGFVRTPLVLYVEHDTWPVGSIDWRGLAQAVEMQAAGVGMVRLHYDASIHPEHRYLMLDEAPVDAAGVPLRRTMQWSQRPHLARADWYARILAEHFGPDDRTMIEDPMYGIAVGSPWERFGLAIYQPPGDMKRSATCDGRGDDPKYSMTHRGKKL